MDEKDGNIFGKKLRKTETVKQKIEQPKLEKVHLKHHEFEAKPQDVLDEEVGSICLSEPILEKPDEAKAKVNKKKDLSKIKKKKPKDIKLENQADERLLDEPCDDFESRIPSPEVNTEKATVKSVGQHMKPIQAATESGYAPTKETAERRERDPIAAPAAAIQKKHSDLEKVELPAYLNYPSDQGIIMPEDHVAEAAVSEVDPKTLIQESVHDEDTSRAPIVESQVMTRAGKKIKKPSKEKKFVDIPIVIEKPESLTNETVNEVGFVCLCFFFYKIFFPQPVIEEPSEVTIDTTDSVTIVEASEQDLAQPPKVYQV